MTAHAPIIVIELLLVLGGALGFGWWQLRELKKLREQRDKDQQAAPPADADDSTDA